MTKAELVSAIAENANNPAKTHKRESFNLNPTTLGGKTAASDTQRIDPPVPLG